ncbi:MAG: nicotinamide mononucleotide deamidase-related protein [Fervidicoccaceae archaeon]
MIRASEREEERRAAWIINVGTELVLGVTVNTNGAWLARRLTSMGFDVRRIVAVPDDEELTTVLRESLSSGARLIVITGGLGPTHDDKTHALVAEALGLRLVLDERALRLIERFYASRGLELTEERLKMAHVPEGAEVLPNPVGAAPGSAIRRGPSLIVCLPGVPREMEAVFEKAVPLISAIAPRLELAEAFIYVRGVPESTLAPFLRRIAAQEPLSYIKSHPQGHELDEPVLKIHVVARGSSREEAIYRAKRVSALVAEAAEKLGGQVEHSGSERGGDA